jgi:hypothetical protein
MKIKRKGDKLYAYRDENDVEGFNPRIKVGAELGFINIRTKKFTGNTVCLVELHKEAEKIMDKLVDDCIERIKEDVEIGDVTAIDELLRFVPIEYLEGFLPEDI